MFSVGFAVSTPRSHLAPPLALQSLQSLEHFCGAVHELLAETKDVVVAHCAGLDILAELHLVQVAVAPVVLQLN